MRQTHAKPLSLEGEGLPPFTKGQDNGFTGSRTSADFRRGFRITKKQLNNAVHRFLAAHLFEEESGIIENEKTAPSYAKSRYPQ
jgi:hypothetical protein